MSKRVEKLPNGEAVREFYSSLEVIKDYYWNKGYRKKAYLYRTLKEKFGWKMSLESFKYHFKRAVESNINNQSKNQISKKTSTQNLESKQKTDVSKSNIVNEFDEDTQKSMEEYMKNMEPFFQKKY